MKLVDVEIAFDGSKITILISRPTAAWISGNW